MSISTIRRQVKNVAFNFSEAQIKVREATSNDPWGPSTSLMSEIADLTHNPVAFIEIMSMIWKRLNDSGKNWRHVYKSLVLLEFIAKCGHEKVVQQCKENIFTIETLKDFQYIEGDRDEGVNVRTLSERMTQLLANRELLNNERAKFMLTREKYAQKNPKSVGNKKKRRSHVIDSSPDLDSEKARLSIVHASEEEDMQLQIALAMSREESEKADEMRRSDDARLQMALEESQKESKVVDYVKKSALDDLLSLGFNENENRPSSSAKVIGDPWASEGDSWPMTATATTIPTVTSATEWNPFGVNTTPVAARTSSNPFDVFGGDLLTPTSSLLTATTAVSTSTTNNNRESHKNAENFLGEHKHLVNLDNLML